jgi:hypothetical protein
MNHQRQSRRLTLRAILSANAILLPWGCSSTKQFNFLNEERLAVSKKKKKQLIAPPSC